MFDAATEVKDPDKTEVNKTVVRNFVDDILINGKMEKLAGYFDSDNYIQHNPRRPLLPLEYFAVMCKQFKLIDILFVK